MTLEAALQENTAAIRALARLFAGVDIDKVAQQAATVEKSKARAEKPSPKPAAAKSSEPIPPASERSANASTESSATSENKQATYDDARRVLVELSQAQGADAVRDALSRFGAKKLPDLLPEHYGALIDLVKEVLAGEQV